MIIYAFDLLGTFAFAISGAIAASNKKFDLFGATFAAFVTAVGGGSIRDLFIGNLPVSWLNDINYLIVILLGVAATFLFNRRILVLRKTLFLFDTIGIGVFTIIGLQKALQFGIHPVMAGIMGLFSAVLGGVIRDTLCNDIPLIFKKEIYATACLLGAAVFFLLIKMNIPEDYTTVITIVIIILIRTLSVRYNWSLPRLKQETQV